jgi:hypothetical protein
MPTPTYTLIASSTVGAGSAGEITFSSIPSTYTDLSVLITSRVDVGDSGDQLRIKFNGSTSNLTARLLYGTGSSALSTSISGYVGPNDTTSQTASVFSNMWLYVPNYRSSSFKSYSVDAVQENNSSGAYSILTAGLWSDTSAITSLGLYPNVGSLVQYSTAYLYGIVKS